MNLKKQLIQGTAWTFLKNGGEQFVSLLVFLVLARLLTPEAFGLIAMAKAFIGILDQFSDFGFNSAIIQKKDINEKHLSSTFWFNFSICMLLAIGFYSASPYIAQLYDEPELVLVTQLLSLVFVFNGLKRVQFAILKKNLEFKKLAVFGLLSSIAAGTVGVSMAMLDYGVYSLVGYQLTSGFILLCMYWVSASWTPKLKFSIMEFKELFNFGINVVGWRFFSSSKRRVFDYLVGYFYGATILGYFAVAFKLIDSLNTIFTKTVWKVLFPVFAKLQDNVQQMRAGFLKVNRLIMGLIVPVYLLLGINSEIIVVAVFGEQWANTAILVTILVVAGMVKAQAGIIRQFLMSTGNVKIITISTFLSFLIITCLILLLRNSSQELIALAYVGAHAIALVIVLIAIMRELKIHFKQLIQTFIPTAFITLLLPVLYVGMVAFNFSEVNILIATVLLAFIIFAILNLKFYKTILTYNI